MELKAIRIWILGASFSAFLFLALSTDYEFWAMKTLINTNTNHENTTYFGLWTKCFDYRGPNVNGTKQVMISICEKYSDGGTLLDITGTPGFIKVTRGFLIFFVVLMALSTIVTGVFMFKFPRPLIYISGINCFIGVIVGVLIMAIFLGSVDHKTLYEDYSPAWAFYYFLIGWMFTLSAFCAALTDRKCDGEQKF